MKEAKIDESRLQVVSDSEKSDIKNNILAIRKDLPIAFEGQTMNECLSEALELDVPNMLFSEFVIEQELTVIYTKSNIGKSVLALQIAHGISRGTAINGLVNEADPQPVIYFDLELSPMQVLGRYSEMYRDSEGKRKYKNPFKFSNNLHRYRFSKNNCPPGTKRSEYIFNSIIKIAKEKKSKIIFIDNISWLSTKGLEKMEDAKELMRMLIDLCEFHKYTVVVVAHTPKIENRPILLKDLAGSSGIGNFCDSAIVLDDSIALGKPHKYLKQEKCRSAEKIYDVSNVLNLTMEKREGNFIGFEIAEVDDEFRFETSHFTRTEIKSTAKYDEQQKIEAQLKIKRAIEQDPSISSRKLEIISGVSHNTANRYRKEIEENPQLFDGLLNPKKEEDES